MSIATVRGRAPARRRTAGQVASRSIPLVPAIGLLVVFLAGPIVASFTGSFTDTALTGPAAAHPQFVGLRNYVELFTSDGFPLAVLLTVVFIIGSAVIGQNVLGMMLAVLMRSGGRLVGAVVGTIVVGAWVLPEIVGAFAAYAFFSKDGTLNAALGLVGINGPEWLFSLPMLSVVLANIWRGAAFSMLMYSAALQDVPTEILEAAEVDGSSRWSTFFRVTLPVIRSSITTNLMLTTLQTLSVFTLIFVMTAGGPGTATTTLPLLAYQEAFRFSELGYGTAIATVLLLIGGGFAIAYIRALRPEVN